MTTRIGLALSGGGARGLAHIGALKVLEEARIPIHLLAGTSMGGLIATLYASGRSAADIEALARSVRLLDIVQRSHGSPALLGREKMANRLRDILDGEPTFSDLRVPVALVAVDLDTGREVIIREGSVIEGIMATTAVPAIFPHQPSGACRLVDGGIVNPVPFDVVRQMGADRVIAVHTIHHPLGGPAADEQTYSSRGESVIRLLLHRSRWNALLDICERSVSIMTARLVEQRLQDLPPDLMIQVPLAGVGLFDLSKLELCVRAGEEAARQRLPELLALQAALD